MRDGHGKGFGSAPTRARSGLHGGSTVKGGRARRVRGNSRRFAASLFLCDPGQLAQASSGHVQFDRGEARTLDGFPKRQAPGLARGSSSAAQTSPGYAQRRACLFQSAFMTPAGRPAIDHNHRSRGRGEAASGSPSRCLSTDAWICSTRLLYHSTHKETGS